MAQTIETTPASSFRSTPRSFVVAPASGVTPLRCGRSKSVPSPVWQRSRSRIRPTIRRPLPRHRRSSRRLTPRHFKIR